MDVLVVVELGVELPAELGADVAAGHPVPGRHRHRQGHQHQRQHCVALATGKRILSMASCLRSRPVTPNVVC